MNIIRKLKTARSVLLQHGATEVLGLLRDNIRMFFTVIGRVALRLWHSVVDRIAGNFPRRSEKMRILYITTEFEAYHSQTVRYRIHNFRQALFGIAKTRFELVKEVHSLEWADVVILMRTTWTKEVDEIFKKADKLRVPVVFDVDDIIFLPEYAKNYCIALDDTSDENIELHRKEFEGFEKTFKRCLFATASTSFIAEKMERAGKRAFVLHNGLNKKQLKIAAAAYRKPQDVRAIGYLSGTKTHDRDFQQVLPALEKIIAEYPDVVLRLAGYIDVSTLPPTLAKKMQTACYMSWGRLMKYGAQNYINIAPLDISNPFCHAKSELKYFEAAIVAVPTVASATDTFSRCIENEKNGMLASSEEDWYRALKKLLDDKMFYEHLAQEAKHQAALHYSPEAAASEVMEAYRAIIKEYRGG
jgi:glycosyltransferase involved in cell wall biosynthesis